MSVNIRILLQRFLEILLTCFIVSSIITVLHKMGMLITRPVVAGSLIIGAVIFFVANVRMLRICYYDMGKYHIQYYILNTLAYLLFALICFIVYFFAPSELYAWFFSITKLIKYTINEISTHYSALFFHFIGLATVYFAPVGMKFTADDE